MAMGKVELFIVRISSFLRILNLVFQKRNNESLITGVSAHKGPFFNEQLDP